MTQKEVRMIGNILAVSAYNAGATSAQLRLLASAFSNRLDDEHVTARFNRTNFFTSVCGEFDRLETIRAPKLRGEWRKDL